MSEHILHYKIKRRVMDLQLTKHGYHSSSHMSYCQLSIALLGHTVFGCDVRNINDIYSMSENVCTHFKEKFIENINKATKERFFHHMTPELSTFCIRYLFHREHMNVRTHQLQDIRIPGMDCADNKRSSGRSAVKGERRRKTFLRSCFMW
jgi:hypothetical protein